MSSDKSKIEQARDDAPAYMDKLQREGREHSIPTYMPLSIRDAGPEYVEAWHDPRPVVDENKRLREALGLIVYITETNFENSGEMSEAIDRIHDIAYAAGINANSEEQQQ